MPAKKSEVQIHFGIVVKQINQKLQNAGKSDTLEVIYHNDDNFEVNKVCKNGDKKYIKLSCSARELADFLDGLDISFKFE